MPLRPGMPVSDAIHELTHHGSRPRSHEQIVAIAMANHDRGKHADGGITKGLPHLAIGGMGFDPYFERQEARDIGYESQYHPGGFIESDTAGRTDRLPMSVAADSFVVPADVVSGLGQGNSLNGAKVMDAILSSGPYGTRLPHQVHGHGPPSPHRSAGGHPGKSDVIVAGGEYSIPPDKIARIGHRMRKTGKSKAHTDLAAGHEALRELVKRVRAYTVKWLKQAPEPKR